MKRITVFLSIITLAFWVCSCGEEAAKASEPVTDTQPSSEAYVIEVSNLYPAADYEYQLHRADDVILGEVIEELGGAYTDPDKLNYWVWQYSVRVDESYKGNFNGGDIVTVIVASESGYSPEDEQALNVAVEVCGGSGECELAKGQTGVFMLKKYTDFKTDDGGDVYTVVFGSEGAFFPVTEGDASMAENAETVYASNSLKLRLSELPSDIARAEAEYANDDGKSELLADDEDEEE